MKHNVFGARVHVPTMALLTAIMQLLAVSSIAAPLPAAAKPTVFKATLYDLDNHRKDPMFLYERTESTQGTEKNVEAIFKNAKGEVAVTEKLKVAAGKVQRYDYEQKQSKESGSVELKDGRYKVIFTNSEKTRSADLEATDSTVVGPTILYYLEEHWAELEKGNDLQLRIVVLNRLDTFGFKFSNDGEEQIDGKTMLRVKLKPTSFFIQAVVAPIYFYFDKTTHKLLLSKGRTLLRYQRDNDMRDFFAETVFE